MASNVKDFATDLRRDMGLLTPAEVAAMLGCTESTLHSWRVKGTGPHYLKLGKTVFYRLVDIGSWANECAITGEGDDEAGDDGA